jgi:Xaa-Pro aminopeptidase
MFTADEKKRRHRAIEKILVDHDLQAILLIGDTSMSHDYCGDFRYYTNAVIVFARQVALTFRNSEPVLFSTNRQSNTFVDDCRATDNILDDTINLLRERGVTSGRIGVSFEMLSVPWYTYLRERLPEAEWVETHDLIMSIRSRHSTEEIDVFRKGAELGDYAYEAALKAIKPGVSEYEIAAEIEHAARTRGADRHFSLIASGRYAPGDANALPFFHSPSARRVEHGDTIIMEITPQYGGYWTQIVRTVNVGRSDSHLATLHAICSDAIRVGLEKMKPGGTVRDVVLSMQSYVTDLGYLFTLPAGHIAGIDLNEARITPQNETILEPGTVMIIHPSVCTPDGKNRVYWGQTYLVTDTGYKCLHRSGDDLLTC